MPDLFTVLIERDAYHSILYAVLGGLLLLSVFHLGMFLQNKDKSYLLYSLYTLFSFMAYIPVAEGGFIATLSESIGFDNDSKTFFTIVFNCIYFFFFAEFLNIKNINPRWYKIIVFPMLFLLSAGILIFIGHRFYGLELLFNLYKNAFFYLIILQTIISFYILTKVKNNLKYYIIVGGLILFICSVIGEKTVREIPALNISRKMGDFIYFIGLLIENMAFSFALGHKQRIVSEQKVAFHKDLILELQKNERLKDEMNRENEKRLTIENEKIKFLQEISDLKFSLLQSRMNPHFIFNALNSIKYYILENDSQNAVDYLTKFSKIIRISLAASSLKEFTLTEELQTLKLYMDIENLRFDSNINFKITTEASINQDRVKLPPMVLQPFIENAILHGIASVNDKKISVEISSSEDQILITIADNGLGRERAAQIKAIRTTQTKSLGIEIARDMLKSYFGAGKFTVAYTDLVENNIATGTMVKISIPKPEN